MMKIKFKDFLIYAFFAIIAFCKGIDLQSDSQIYLFLYIFGTIMVFIKMLWDKFVFKELLLIVAMLLIGIIDFVCGRVTSVLFTMIAICCMKGIDIKKTIKLMFWVKLITFIGMFFCATTGIIENEYLVRYREGYGITNRYCLGYSHPNRAHAVLVVLVFMFGYIYKKKINLYSLVIIQTINYIIYMFTYSRTGYYIVFLYLIFEYIMKKTEKIRIKEFFSKFIKYVFVIFSISSILVAQYYQKNEIVDMLNELLTGRIRYMNILIENYPIPIIGSVSYHNIVTIDNGFFTLFYEGGLIATIMFGYLAYKTGEILEKKKMYSEIFFVFFVMCYALFENFYMSMALNPTLLFFALYVFKGDNKDESISINNSTSI